MNIKQAKQEIEHTVRAYLARDELGCYLIPALRQRPVLLMGPPGVGKTQIMAQIAAEMGVGLVAYTITHHTRQSAIGLPFIEKRCYGGEEFSVTAYTMSEILSSVHELMEQTEIREGILFLDEINCVSETLTPMMLQFLQCKTFGNQTLPEGWIIVAAGNPPEYNKSVREFDVVTLDRVKRIDVAEDFAVWKEYAYRRGLHGAIISYLDIKKEHFYRIETTVDGMAFATARGWEDLSELIYAYERLKLPVDYRVVEQYIQLPRIARDFASYLALYYKYQKNYQVEDILGGKWHGATALELRAAAFDERLSVLGLLLARLAEESRETRRRHALTQALHADLLDCKTRLAAGQTAAQALGALAEERQAALNRAKTAGQLDKEGRQLALSQLQALEDYARELGTCGGEAAAEGLRVLFQPQVDSRTQAGEETGCCFENAFRFLEETFGQSQELVIFVTELTAGYDSSWFIENFGCDAYFRHNKELLFDETRHRIRQELAAARGGDALTI